MPKPYSGGRGRRNHGNYVRKNERIRAREVRLIGSDGSQIGVVSRDDALAAAKKMGLDLVEISASARPPVCRILDFGKYMYEQSKRQKENKAKGSSTSKIKEVKFRVRTEEHDYMTKLRHGEEFLYKGNKLKLSLMFRGRENEHKDLGLEVVAKAAKDLSHVGQADGTPKLSGRHVNLIMTPLPVAKRTLKFNESVSAQPPEEE
ncbi:translation initiation factor IF-3 [Puniceicoccales bacterium CK1056]|uniref:Translation initiation factor IF-3 n=1 Tax=Oceanipulchritudo coccoides TaxID=2706888 RepID=A0A6B2LZX4_9BACT|nr:translation initiation factor IF-3 [Oceanipulchritudo coccoides]NDV62218.1 translation initiation factor IF-3 [Oceanipulchritudo coccoides]